MKNSNAQKNGEKSEKNIDWEQKFAEMEVELAQLKQGMLQWAEEMKEEFDNDRKNLTKIEK